MKFQGMYTIKALQKTKLGVVEVTLNVENEWCIATNWARQFHSPHLAKFWAYQNAIVENRPSAGSETCPYIVGPRGGKYSIFTGKRKV